ncbi:MAG: galactose oxidase, partial [Pedobacter sp.]
MPNPIANTCAILLNDVLYVMGGISTADAKTTASSFWALDLANQNATWQSLQTWPGKSRMLSVAGTDGKAIYLLSGVELIDGQRQYL